MKRSSFVSLLFAATMLFAAPASHAVLLHFKAFMDGPSESPPVPSPGTGFAVVDIDTDAHTMDVHAEFADLVAPTTVAHIHCCVAVPGEGTVAVATTTPTFPGFPAGVTSGAYDMLFDLTLASFYNAPFLAANGGTAAGAEAALIAGIIDGRAYFNVHTSMFPAGEIRGFLVVPEPGILGLLGLGLALAFVATRRRRS